MHADSAATVPVTAPAGPAATVVTVVVVDANPLVRLGLTSMLERAQRIRVVGEADDVPRAIEATRRLEPHVVLLDLAPPDHRGLCALPELSRHAAVLVLTSCVEPTIVQRAVRTGALGYLIHGQFGAADLNQAVEAAARGESLLSPAAVDALVRLIRTRPEPMSWSPHLDRLSEREVEVMNCIARGANNAEIARDLRLSEKTVRNHVNHIYTKLGVHTRAQAMAAWLGTGAGDR